MAMWNQSMICTAPEEDLGAKIAMGGCRCGRRLGIETAR
jgi:hypothetical protein